MTNSAAGELAVLRGGGQVLLLSVYRAQICPPVADTASVVAWPETTAENSEHMSALSSNCWLISPWTLPPPRRGTASDLQCHGSIITRVDWAPCAVPAVEGISLTAVPILPTQQPRARVVC
jgi:hypothetical protein